MKNPNIGVIQCPDGARFELKAFRNCSFDTLMATIRFSRASRARYTSPIPPAPIGATIS